ncbi:MAG: ATP-dependent helicase [Dehalococcoidia bacterium]|nr:ATP-dependent helicase [Dehalococcoidia bacterium]
MAGPGTGKSASIEERTVWLLTTGVPATGIYATSFTRASAHDLGLRIRKRLQAEGLATAQIHVSTLHALALRALRLSGQLNQYPVEPRVLDEWETEFVFDREFGDHTGQPSTERQEKIRLHHEAFWATGQYNPTNYVLPAPPISVAEENAFDAFHRRRTQLYAAVLPGELIRQCVLPQRAGTLDVRTLLGIEHLIVDEYQDLNELDQEFVSHIATAGATLFIAGDDDQSVYSFRFAAPLGIQTFDQTNPGCGVHALSDCFRCSPTVLGVANTLIQAYGSATRLPKAPVALLGSAQPPVQGRVFRWRMANGNVEAKAVAESCRDLIAAGVPPERIMILPANYRSLRSGLKGALDATGVDAELQDEDRFVARPAGRLIYALLRLVSSSDDYVALRTVLGIRKGVGIKTCNAIADAVTANNFNYRDLFYVSPLPFALPSTRAQSALTAAQGLLNSIVGWQSVGTLSQHLNDFTAMVTTTLDQAAAAEWTTFAAALPGFLTLEELTSVMAADGDQQRRLVFEAAYQRLGQPLPVPPPVPSRVQIMTMHGAKGLDADVVFITGLEDELIPGPHRNPYVGLVEESARLLFVSITRARVCCVLSYVSHRFHNGTMANHSASRYANHLNGAFGWRTSGLTAAECQAVVTDRSNL